MITSTCSRVDACDIRSVGSLIGTRYYWVVSSLSSTLLRTLQCTCARLLMLNYAWSPSSYIVNTLWCGSSADSWVVLVLTATVWSRSLLSPSHGFYPAVCFSESMAGSRWINPWSQLTDYGCRGCPDRRWYGHSKLWTLVFDIPNCSAVSYNFKWKLIIYAPKHFSARQHISPVRHTHGCISQQESCAIANAKSGFKVI